MTLKAISATRLFDGVQYHENAAMIWEGARIHFIVLIEPLTEDIDSICRTHRIHGTAYRRPTLIIATPEQLSQLHWSTKSKTLVTLAAENISLGSLKWLKDHHVVLSCAHSYVTTVQLTAEKLALVGAATEYHEFELVLHPRNNPSANFYFDNKLICDNIMPSPPS